MKTKTQISFAITTKLISGFVFATRIVQSLYFLNTKIQASSHLLWLYSLVCVGPGRKPRRPVFSERGSYHMCDRDTRQLISFATPNGHGKKPTMSLSKWQEHLIFISMTVAQNYLTPEEPTNAEVLLREKLTNTDIAFSRFIQIRQASTFKAEIQSLDDLLFQEIDQNLSHIRRKPVFALCFCICKIQRHRSDAADQHLCFCYIDSTIPLLLKCEI